MNGIVISNHGGRQVDGAVATLDVLPKIAAVVKKRIPFCSTAVFVVVPTCLKLSP
ncbi:MAG: alpha-hydroxy-acid oxidizing protein [Bacteroidota bacterium]